MNGLPFSITKGINFGFRKKSLFPLFFQHLSWVAITIALLYHLSGDGRNSLEQFLSNVRRFFPSIFCGIAAFLFQSSTHFLCSASISIALFPQPISETHFRQCTNIGGNINLTLKCMKEWYEICLCFVAKHFLLLIRASSLLTDAASSSF